MTTQNGDIVTIKRGKLSGQTGEIIAHQNNPAAYVLKMADGTFSVQNVTNVREPVEATITQDELAAILASAEDKTAAIHALDAKYPGFAVRGGFKDAGPDFVS